MSWCVRPGRDRGRRTARAEVERLRAAAAADALTQAETAWEGEGPAGAAQGGVAGGVTGGSLPSPRRSIYIVSIVDGEPGRRRQRDTQRSRSLSLAVVCS